LDGILESGNGVKNWRVEAELRRKGCVFVFVFFLNIKLHMLDGILESVNRVFFLKGVFFSFKIFIKLLLLDGFFRCCYKLLLGNSVG
jgi:hypothetical protein